MTQEPKHKTIKVWYSTYRALKKLAAEKPESLASLIDRLVQDGDRNTDRNTDAVDRDDERRDIPD